MLVDAWRFSEDVSRKNTSIFASKWWELSNKKTKRWELRRNYTRWRCSYKKTTNKVPMATRKHDFDSRFTREILKNHNFRRKLSAYQKTTFWIIEKLGNRYELRWHFVKFAPYLKRNINVPNVELITVLSIVFKIHERNKEELDKYCKNWNWKILVKLKPPTRKKTRQIEEIKSNNIWKYDIIKRNLAGDSL